VSEPRVIIGMQGVQMPANALRGIGRWCTEYIVSLLESHPGMVAGICVDDRLALPHLLARLGLDVPVFRTSDGPPAALRSGDVFHVLSPLEDLTIDRIWPVWARGPEVGLVATIYDMIPLLFPEDYFQGSLRRLLQVRYELYRQCDATLSISRATADDAVRLLELDPLRSFVAPGGISQRFVPPIDGRSAAAAALAPMGVEPGFILSIGNVDPRKNLPTLIDAYSSLPATLRNRHQLVLTCSQADRAHLDRLIEGASRHSVADRVVALPFVDDRTMLHLYSGCELMAYPSLYEGLGLPLIEASACGAAVVCSDVGPMRDIVTDPDARFDPSSVEAITDLLSRCLTEPELLERFRSRAVADAARYTWSGSIDAAAGAYRQAVRR
jgi:glycosyltransferase involved in cell wall biosynthesis